MRSVATKRDLYLALALTVRDRVCKRTVDSLQDYGGANARRVAYLSAEYLPGPHLANNLLNLGITEVTRDALYSLGEDLDEIIAQEEEPGLGRLASCFMDSLASVEVPAIGYGIRYEFGIFDQVIQDGWQREITDRWLPFAITASESGGSSRGGGDECPRVLGLSLTNKPVIKPGGRPCIWQKIQFKPTGALTPCRARSNSACSRRSPWRSRPRPTSHRHWRLCFGAFAKRPGGLWDRPGFLMQLRKPPNRNEVPSMKSELVTIAPAIDALTSMYCPA